MADGIITILFLASLLGIVALWEKIDDAIFWHRRRHKREEYKRFLSRYKNLPKSQRRAVIEIYECYKSWQESMNK